MLPLHFLLIFLLVLFEFSKFKVVHCNEVHVNHYATCFNLLVHKRSLYTYRNCFGLQTFDWDKYQSKLWAMCLMFQVSTCMKYIYFDWSDLFAKKISWVWKTMSINITIRRLFVMNRHVMFSKDYIFGLVDEFMFGYRYLLVSFLTDLELFLAEC